MNPHFVKLGLCAVASLMEVLRGLTIGFPLRISFHFLVGKKIKFDSAPEPIKNLFQNVVVKSFCFLSFLK